MVSRAFAALLLHPIALDLTRANRDGAWRVTGHYVQLLHPLSRETCTADLALATFSAMRGAMTSDDQSWPLGVQICVQRHGDMTKVTLFLMRRLRDGCLEIANSWQQSFSASTSDAEIAQTATSTSWRSFERAGYL